MSLRKKVLKSISWRAHASASTIIVSYLFTGQLKIAGAITATLVVIKLLLYVFHEKLWEEILPKSLWLDED